MQPANYIGSKEEEEWKKNNTGEQIDECKAREVQKSIVNRPSMKT